MSFRKRHIISVILILSILLLPIETTKRDNGVKTYTAILYKVIIWSTPDEKVEIEVYAFPMNFHDIDHYKNLRDQSEQASK